MLCLGGVLLVSRNDTDECSSRRENKTVVLLVFVGVQSFLASGNKINESFAEKKRHKVRASEANANVAFAHSVTCKRQNFFSSNKRCVFETYVI